MDRKDMTLAGAFEAVAQNLKESGLTDSAFAKVADETSYIKAKLRVTPIQAFILATMLHHMDRTMQMMTFATFAQVSPVRILAMQKDFDCLAKKGYIVCTISTTYHDVEQSYALSAGIILAVKYDKRVTSAYYKNLTSEDVLHIIGDLIWKCDHSQLTYPNLVTCMDRLIADTQHVELCKKIKAYDMRRADLIFFLIGVVCLVSKGEDLCTSVRMA